MLGIDLAVGLLIVGILVLCATTAVSILPWLAPTMSPRRRSPTPREIDGAQRDRPIQASYRRVVTGQPASMARIALPAGRPEDPPADGRSHELTDVDAAEALIDRLLDHDPELIAALMTQWIREDESERPTGTAETILAADLPATRTSDPDTGDEPT